MSSNGTFQGDSLKIQLLHKGSLLLLAAMASVFVALQRHNGTMMAAVLAVATVAAPVGYVLMRRLIEKLRQRETEDRLMVHTRTYLQTAEPVRAASAARESDIEKILARTINGRKLPLEDFLKIELRPLPPPAGDPVVFGALPQRDAIRSLCDGRFANLAAMLPEPVYRSLTVAAR